MKRWDALPKVRSFAAHGSALHEARDFVRERAIDDRLPKGVTEYNTPTSLVWIIGRTYCTGTPEDYKAVHELQDKYKLVPLSAYGKDPSSVAGLACRTPCGFAQARRPHGRRYSNIV